MSDLPWMLEMIDRAYNRRSWHGTNLRGSIRGMTATDAAWRPAPNRHNIWELVVHAAYWKYVVWRRLSGERRGGFPLKGSDWFQRPSPSIHSSGTLPEGRNSTIRAQSSRHRAEPAPLAPANQVHSGLTAAGARAWKEDVALLDRMHQELRASIGKLSARDLHRALPGGSGTVTAFELVAGIAAHDLYHAGQIQLIKRLRPRS